MTDLGIYPTVVFGHSFAGQRGAEGILPTPTVLRIGGSPGDPIGSSVPPEGCAVAESSVPSLSLARLPNTRAHTAQLGLMLPEQGQAQRLCPQDRNVWVLEVEDQDVVTLH